MRWEDAQRLRLSGAGSFSNYQQVRFATPNTTLPPRYTYTGQYSYINDEATNLGSVAFGLMFYNARSLRSVPVAERRGTTLILTTVPNLTRLYQTRPILRTGTATPTHETIPFDTMTQRDMLSHRCSFNCLVYP